MRTGASSTASWPRRAAGRPPVGVPSPAPSLRRCTGVAAALLALLPAPAQAAFACEPVGLPALARQADLVFTGTVVRRFQDGAEPAGWTRPLLGRWPAWLPVPEEPAPAGRETPAVTLRASTLYKGALPGPEVTVRLLGRARAGAGPWTIFASRGERGHLFTTECSGNWAGSIEPAAYGLQPGVPVRSEPWWQAAAPPGALLLALILGAALLALVGRRVGVRARR